MIAIEGKVNALRVSILIDYGATFSYVNDNLVDRCKIMGRKLHKHILEQLTTGMKMKVIAVVEGCNFTMSGLQTKYNLDIIPLESYDSFVGMDWIKSHHVILD